MTSIFNKRARQILKLFIGISLIIPMLILAYESIILGKQSVVFLADYPEVVGFIVIVYYVLLVVTGIIWGVFQLKSLLTLKNEKMKNELIHLQSQVSPHFFFNMLNNIYGTIDTSPETTKKMILKLSELMRYSIYEGEKNKLSLKEELSYLKNYISLHQMRYHKEIDIQWEENILDEHIKVTPLLYIILLENAFKHGVEKMRDNADVYICVVATADRIDFTISNSFDAEEKTETGGFGLKNLRRRLALLYPKQHQLKIEIDESRYQTHLSISL